MAIFSWPFRWAMTVVVSSGREVTREVRVRPRTVVEILRSWERFWVLVTRRLPPRTRLAIPARVANKAVESLGVFWGREKKRG